MPIQPTLLQRWDAYKASKTVIFWACAGSAVATMVVGFGWGGWVTGGSADKRVTEAATEARAQLAASFCVERFGQGSDAPAKLASLKGTESWQRDKFIEKGGWVTLPGTADPVSGAAALCARQLVDASPAKASVTQ